MSYICGMKHLREDEETVVSIDHRNEVAWLSTTRKGLRDRCLAKGWILTEEHKDDKGRPRRWVFRGVPENLVRIVPRSKVQVLEHKKRSEAVRHQFGAVRRITSDGSGIPEQK